MNTPRIVPIDNHSIGRTHAFVAPSTARVRPFAACVGMAFLVDNRRLGLRHSLLGGCVSPHPVLNALLHEYCRSSSTVLCGPI